MEKQVEILSGLEADDKNNKVKIDLKGAGEESESGLTVSINFYLLRETFCTVFAAEDFKVQVEGTALIVYYKIRSLFGQALIYRYLNVNQVQTVDICSRGGKIELYINCAKIGEADLTEKFILKDLEETFIGGSRYCFVRWFRIYRETLNGAEIRKRVLGNETLESDQANFDKKPALYYDFTGRDDTSGQGISMCGTSRIVQLHECLQMESRGTVLLIPGIPLFQERDTSIRFTIKPGIVSMKEECLFHIGAAGVFALLVRENEEGKRFLDIEAKCI